MPTFCLLAAHSIHSGAFSRSPFTACCKCDVAKSSSITKSSVSSSQRNSELPSSAGYSPLHGIRTAHQSSEIGTAYNMMVCQHSVRFHRIRPRSEGVVPLTRRFLKSHSLLSMSVYCLLSVYNRQMKKPTTDIGAKSWASNNNCWLKTPATLW
jgi:hypothetical protein